MSRTRVLCRGVALFLLSAGIVLPAAAGEGRVPVPEIVKAKGDQCVEPTAVIRKDHMKFLRHHRDDTVHQGIRTTRHSLKACIECHAGRDEAGKPVPVTAPGQFCESCHSYAAVKLDCFACHATTPEK